ncbi:MAG: A24 family peptidase [Candidatus Limnocylindrales bacterium]
MSEPLLIAVLAAAGAALGFAADRLSVRWPDHEEDYKPRGIDWRTAVVSVAGAVVFGGIAARWGESVAGLAILIGFAAALLVLLATDLDQRLLPDWITLPLIGYSALVLVAGWSPLLADRSLGLMSGLIAGIGAPAFLLVTDRLFRGDLGLGDVKLAVSIGFVTGVSLLVTGVLVASILFSAVLLTLMALRRVGLKSAVPFGPVLIFGAFVAVLVG